MKTGDIITLNSEALKNYNDGDGCPFCGETEIVYTKKLGSHFACGYDGYTLKHLHSIDVEIVYPCKRYVVESLTILEVL